MDNQRAIDLVEFNMHCGAAETLKKKLNNKPIMDGIWEQLEAYQVVLNLAKAFLDFEKIKNMKGAVENGG